MAGRLLEEMHAVMRRRHYSIHTERSYSDWVKRYVSYHKRQSTDDANHWEMKIEAFLTHLALDLHVAPSTQNHPHGMHPPVMKR